MGLAIKRYLKFISLPGKAIVLLVTICACLQVGAFAQDRHTIDSLKSLLRNNNDTIEYETLVALARIHADVYHDNDSALLIVQKAINIADNLRDTIKMVQSGRMMGTLLYRLSRPQEATELLSKLLPISVRHSLKWQEARILIILAILHYQKSEYDKSMKFNINALQLMEEVHGGEVTSILNNIGLIYYKLSNYEKAVYYYKLALERCEKIGDYVESDRFWINLSLAYAQNDDGDIHRLDIARRCIENAYKVCGKNCRKKITAEGEFALGVIEFSLNDFKKAKTHFLHSYTLAKELKHTLSILDNLLTLAELSLKQGELDEAEYYLNLSDKINADRTFRLNELTTYRHFISLYKLKMDYRKQLFYEAKYISLKDSLYNEELMQNLAVTQIEFEQRENKAKLESQSEMIRLHEQFISRQKTINYLACVATMLLLSLLIALYVNDRTKRRERSELEVKVKERTRELEDSYEFLHKAYTEQRHHVASVVGDIKRAMPTFDGLCVLLKQEVSSLHGEKFEKPVDDLAGCCARFFAECGCEV